MGNLWQRKLTIAVDSTNEDLEKYILQKHLSQYLDKGILRIIQNCVKNTLYDRYRSMGGFIYDLEKYFMKKGENLQLSSKRLFNRIHLIYYIESPVRLMETQEIKYDGENRIGINGIKNCIIKFENHVIIKIKKEDQEFSK